MTEPFHSLSGRVAGIDVARALAIIGMMAAHLAYTYASLNGPGITGAYWATGYPSSLFAVLAGVSLGFLTQRTPYAQVLRRAVVLALLGGTLSMAQYDITIVLVPIAFELAILGAVAHWSTRRLAILFAALLLLGPLLTTPVWALYLPIINGTYPLLAWLAYGACGLLIYRLLITEQRPAWVLGALGIAGVAVAVVAGLLGLRGGSEELGWSLGEAVQYTDTLPPDKFENWTQFNALTYLSPHAHSGGLGDVALSCALSLGIIALCLLACRATWFDRAAYPVRAFGSMALTMYVLHVFTAAWLLLPAINNVVYSADYDVAAGDDWEGMPWPEYQDAVASAGSYEEFWEAEAEYWEQKSPHAEVPVEEEPESVPSIAWWCFGGSVLGGLLFASLWKLKFRRGPLEEALRWLIARRD